MKKVGCLILVAIIALSFCSCSLFKEKDYKISYDLKTEPVNLDPQTATDKASLMVINNIFEGLFIVDSDGEIKPALAESHQISANGKVYTFTLKSGLKWEDETPLTADDFVFAFRRLLRKDTKSVFANQYFSISNATELNNMRVTESELGVVAKSSNVLEITLHEKNDNFLMLLTQTATMPCNEKFFKKTSGKYGLEPTTILSNGAYALGSWKHKEYIRLDKNEFYHSSDKSTANGISLWINTKKTVDDKQVYNSPVNRLNDGNVTSAVVNGIDINEISQNKFNIEKSQEFSECLVFNQKNKYLANKNLRLAISHAFDRKSYQAILGQTHSVANAIIPSSIMLFGGSFRQFAGDNIVLSFDTTLAFEHYKTALMELNTDVVGTLKMIALKNDKLPVQDYFSYPSQVIQRELGVFISIEELEPAEYKARLASSDFDVALVELGSIDGDASSMMTEFHSLSSENYYNYNNPEFDKALTESITKTDATIVNNAVKLCEQTLISDGAVIPVLYKNDYLVSSKKLTGLSTNPYNGLISFKDVRMN